VCHRLEIRILEDRDGTSNREACISADQCIPLESTDGVTVYYIRLGFIVIQRLFTGGYLFKTTLIKLVLMPPIRTPLPGKKQKRKRKFKYTA
jgi:hypothetical protein